MDRDEAADQVWVDRPRGLVRLEPRGPVDGARLESLLLAMYRHPEFTPGMPALWDLRHADVSAIHANDMARIGGFNAAHEHVRGRARAAFVTSGTLAYGLARMFEAVAEVPHLTTQIFTDVDEALAWLTDPESPRG